ncbi:MAG: flavoprotein, partial [Elusimicrobiaceae bacterium]
QDGYQVKTSCTVSALNFIGLATLEGLTGKPVYLDTFEKKQSIEHVELSRWLDVLVLCPATANIINKLAAGIGDDCVTTTCLAHDFSKPLIIVPAMNKNMWEHPATRNSLNLLLKWGAQVLPTTKGRLACGDTGYGRMLEPEDIYSAILKALH